MYRGWVSEVEGGSRHCLTHSWDQVFLLPASSGWTILGNIFCSIKILYLKTTLKDLYNL